jgi:hypothetical protein
VTKAAPSPIERFEDRHGIEPHIPLLDREHQTNGFSPAPTSPLT